MGLCTLETNILRWFYFPQDMPFALCINTVDGRIPLRASWDA